MSENPTVSVVIPTYNRARFVGEAIDSVLCQSYKDYEIIVVDDGSEDNTSEVLEGYGERIKSFYQENRGVSSARNKGIEMSRGRWVAFLDSDDIWYEDKLAVHMDFISRYSDVIVHAVKIKLPLSHNKGETNFESYDFFPTEIEGLIERPVLMQLRKQKIMIISASIYSRESLIEAGCFDEELSIGEDFDLMCRLSVVGRWGYSDKLLGELLRRQEKKPISLSAFMYEDFLKVFRSEQKAYLKMYKLSDKMGEDEFLEVKRSLGRVSHELGLENLAEGDRGSAKREFLRSFGVSRNFKAIVWYFVSCFLSSFGVRLARSRIRSRRGEDYKFACERVG